MRNGSQEGLYEMCLELITSSVPRPTGARSDSRTSQNILTPPTQKLHKSFKNKEFIIVVNEQIDNQLKKVHSFTQVVTQ